MKINRKLLGCSLIFAIILSLFSFPSLGIRSFAAPPAAGQGPVDQAPNLPMTAPLVQDQTRDGELSKHFRKYDVVRMDPAAAWPALPAPRPGSRRYRRRRGPGSPDTGHDSAGSRRPVASPRRCRCSAPAGLRIRQCRRTPVSGARCARATRCPACPGLR